MMRLLGLGLAAFALSAPGSAGAGEPRAKIDPEPRTAIMSAFPPELALLEADLTQPRVYDLAGARYVTGRLEGRAVVLFLSGVSMVNAAMTSERAIENFNLRRILFSGIAGGVDPALEVGDVVVPDRWSEYLESVMARETAPGVFAPPPEEPLIGPHLGMMFPARVEAGDPQGRTDRREWFPADPGLLALTRSVARQVSLKRCTAEGVCLRAPPKVRVGGAGVSGPAFADNADLRAFLQNAFSAEVVDMESAAVAHVAYSNGVPFLAFRSLSDLAGGDQGRNQAYVLFRFAADNSAAVVEAVLKASPD